MHESPEDYMQQVLALAEGALELGELPIAALVILEGRVIGMGTASEVRENRYLGHAELVALEQADRLGLAFEQRHSAWLFTNLEPCLMCMGAAMSFFLGGLYFALESPGDGAVALAQGWLRREQDIPGYQLPEIVGGLLREESIALFKRYVAKSPPGPMRAWAETLARL